jgi:hypothetical protein
LTPSRQQIRRDHKESSALPTGSHDYAVFKVRYVPDTNAEGAGGALCGRLALPCQPIQIRFRRDVLLSSDNAPFSGHTSIPIPCAHVKGHAEVLIPHSRPPV